MRRTSLRCWASALTSGSSLARAAGKPALAGPAPAASPAATSAFNATIFSFFLEDIVGLPFDSNSTKVGVSRYIGTNGYRAQLVPQFLWSSLQAIEKYLKCILLLN